MGEPEPIDSTDAPRLATWALSSFHAALLVALLVGVLYAVGNADQLLAGLDTWIGVLAYCYLWVVVWWTNRSMLEGVEGDLITERPGFNTLLAEAMKWGASAGLLVFLPVLLVAVVRVVGSGGIEAVPFLVLGGAIGVVLSSGLGGIVGVLFAILDLLLLRVAGGWLPDADTGSTPSEP